MAKQVYAIFYGSKWCITTNKKQAEAKAKATGGEIRTMDWSSYKHSGGAWDAPTFYICSDAPSQPHTCKMAKVHDDGDLTLKCKDAKYVVTTDGKTFKEVKK